MMIIIDGSHWSATDINKAIVRYAADIYDYKVSQILPFEDEHEFWTWESEDALEWMDGFARNHGYTYFVDDNSLYMDNYAELSAE